MASMTTRNIFAAFIMCFAFTLPQQGFSEGIATIDADQLSATLLGDTPAPFCGPQSTGCSQQPGAGLGGSTGRGQTCTSTTGHAEKCWEHGKNMYGEICQCFQYLMIDGFKVTCNRSSASELQNPLWKQIIEDQRRR